MKSIVFRSAYGYVTILHLLEMCLSITASKSKLNIYLQNVGEWRYILSNTQVKFLKVVLYWY